MERLDYVLDTNAIADYINEFEPTTKRIKQAIRDGHRLYLCQPVRYEILRGLIRTQATRKRHAFDNQFAPQLIPLALIDEDWRQAAQFWAATVSAGKQLVDSDLLIGAIAKRIGGIVVSADDDFNYLPIRRENWRR
jgi:predicted nucleic acid-binding protein